MPQLDLATFPTQLVWLAVTFIALYLVMALVGLPRVGGIIAKRRDRITGDLDKAQRMKAEAEAVIAAYERALAEARTKAQQALRETAERLAAEATEQQRKLAESLNAEIAKAERRIAEAKASALKGMHDLATEVAQVAAAKLAGGAVEAARVKAAVEAVLRERV
ncbi:MAG: F0F1 ATP synthase subunit B' [Alphaproteobacteria bacterium]|nr:F0F1 ATP synthase subunit B' [Alphaproteobacteria bacterium]